MTQAGLHFFTTPTPGLQHGQQLAAGRLLQPVDGFVSAPFQLTLSPGIPGSSIYYTTDNSEPKAAIGSIRTAALSPR